MAARRRLAGLIALFAGVVACSGSRAPDAAVVELVEWAEGPARWLLLPAERRRLQEVETPAEAVNFLDRFWSLRDPDPADAGNTFHDLFSSRVEAADLLYPEPGLRGALTPRGRALILLGPPVHMRVTTDPALSWVTGRGDDRRVTTRDVEAEIWRYPLDALEPRLARALRAAGFAAGVELRFHLTARGSRLVEGESFLDIAAMVALASG